MHFIADAYTDIGISRDTNQDSVLMKHARCDLGEVLLAIVCDGMGGLSKGELASATVVREFMRWFDNELPLELENLDMQAIGKRWSALLRDLNRKLIVYGRMQHISIGTTFTGILFAGSQYVIVHIGDSRAYRIGSSLRQLTIDHTFVAREIKRGTMTHKQAETDKRRNMLLQCVGATEHIEPDIIVGNIKKGAYMLCTDGFRNKISEAAIYKSLKPAKLHNKEEIQIKLKYLVEQIKQHQETDNISVILIKVE